MPKSADKVFSFDDILKALDSSYCPADLEPYGQFIKWLAEKMEIEDA